MEEATGCSVVTTPSPVPTAVSAAITASATSSADVFPSPPRSSQQQQQQQSSSTTTVTIGTGAHQNAPPVRILGRNVNGTVVQTSMPQNEAELQLYRVMQRASLLSYYDTLLEMGGDDVQQLCDAGEEEFLEIMALVGMASKPLHVRRLQKALQEWLTNPAMFQTPVLVPPAGSAVVAPGVKSSSSSSSTSTTAPVVFPCIGSYSPNTRQQVQSSTNLSVAAAALSSISSQQAAAASKPLSSPSSSLMVAGIPAATPPSVACHAGSPVVQPASQILSQFSAAASCCPIQRRKSLSPPASSLPFGSMQMQQADAMETSVSGAGASAVTAAHPMSHSPGIMTVGNYESSSCGSQGTTPSPGSNPTLINAPQSPTTLLQTTPILLESQVQRLAEAAERLAATLRPLNPKPQSGMKKKMCKNLEMVMAMPDSDPRRMEEIRKYAAIYGRFDCKRKPEKPLTLHEVSVNEAAAQICRFAPALLTRRDELFPLARRVVRDSGQYYTKSLMHSSNTSPRTLSSSRENGDGELSGGDDSSSMLCSDTANNKRRKLELRCTEDDSSVAGNRDHSGESAQQQQQQQQQAESARLRCTGYSRSSAAAIDSDSNSVQAQQTRHRKRQRRRRPLKIGHKSISSPVWQSCSDNSNMVLDGVVDGLDDSDGCYSSFEEDWDDCNDDCEDNFGVDTDDGAGDDGDDDVSASASMMHDVQSRVAADEDETSSMMDKENDFNLKVIASCGDNIIAVANPALMNRNQPTAITKEQTIKEEITLRDRRD